MTIEGIQAELQEEINLCNKYFIEEDMHKDSTERERLALKIVTMCMQTLSALKDGELEDYKHIKQWKSDVMDAFCRYDCNSVEEAIHSGYIKGIQESLCILNFMQIIGTEYTKQLMNSKKRWREKQNENKYE